MATVIRSNQLQSPQTLTDDTIIIVGDPDSGSYLKTNLAALKAFILEGVQLDGAILWETGNAGS